MARNKTPVSTAELRDLSNSFSAGAHDDVLQDWAKDAVGVIRRILRERQAEAAKHPKES